MTDNFYFFIQASCKNEKLTANRSTIQPINTGSIFYVDGSLHKHILDSSPEKKYCNFMSSIQYFHNKMNSIIYKPSALKESHWNYKKEFLDTLYIVHPEIPNEIISLCGITRYDECLSVLCGYVCVCDCVCACVHVCFCLNR